MKDLKIKSSLDDLWPAARHAAMVRDGYRCAKCGAANRSELDVHHRMPRSIQVDHSAANLITLCDGCHATLHLNLQVGLARGVIERWAVRLARVLDFYHELPTSEIDFGPLLHALGKQKLREGQLPIILAILAGKDVLAVRPTGSGKSLCFQIPVLLRPGTGLVLEPLKALMKDQVRGLNDLLLPATFISSDVSLLERRLRYDLLEQGTWKFLYMAPERFNPTIVTDPTESDRLRRFRPNYLVVDEAHVVSQYGDGFRPSYAEIASIRQIVGRPQLLAFTATASTDRQIWMMIDGPATFLAAYRDPAKAQSALETIISSSRKGGPESKAALLYQRVRSQADGEPKPLPYDMMLYLVEHLDRFMIKL